MKLTLLGLSSVLVELHGRNVLIDPVFVEPFGEGVATSCPARRVHVDRLPRIDLLVVSSDRPHHFDVPTLAQLPRDCVVVCCKEPMVARAFERLGFQDVRPTAPNVLLKLGKFELWATASTRNDVEIGVALKDRTGIVWAQLDTLLAPQTIDVVRATFGRIDLLLAGFATSNLMYLGTARPGFPSAPHRTSIASARRVAPRLLVPGTGGFRFTGAFEWTNSFLFPVARERFLADLSREQPDLATAIGNPGDVFEISGEKVERKAQASSVAETIEDDTWRTSFDLTAPVPPLADPNLDAYSPEVLDRAVAECIDGLASFVERAYADDDPLVAAHRRKRLVYGLGVVFPDGRQRWIRFVFDPARPVVDRGDGELRDAESTHRIAASVVAAWWRDERSYRYLGGLSRRSMMLGASLVDGEVVIDSGEPHDLLVYYLAYKRAGAQEGATKRSDFALRPFLPERGP